jgi:hypothetical protein
LEQISYQLQGPGILREPDVVKRLDLTLEQRKRMREIDDEGMDSLFSQVGPGMRPEKGGPGGPGGSGGPGGPRGGGFGGRGGPAGPGGGGGDIEQKMAQTMNKMLEVLTEEQKKIWRDMTGEPYRRDNPRQGPPGKKN